MTNPCAGVPANPWCPKKSSGTFALGSAEYVEVLRGPFSVLYGNASGGVIVVETMDGPAVPTGEAELFAGSYGVSGFLRGVAFSSVLGAAGAGAFWIIALRGRST